MILPANNFELERLVDNDPEGALAILEPQHKAQPENKEVLELLAGCYYKLADTFGRTAEGPMKKGIEIFSKLIASSLKDQRTIITTAAATSSNDSINMKRQLQILMNSKSEGSILLTKIWIILD